MNAFKCRARPPPAIESRILVLISDVTQLVAPTRNSIERISGHGSIEPLVNGVNAVNEFLLEVSTQPSDRNARTNANFPCNYYTYKLLSPYATKLSALSIETTGLACRMTGIACDTLLLAEFLEFPITGVQLPSIERYCS